MQTTTPLEKIRLRAYELYQARGGVPGYEQQDWLEAERAIMQRPRSSEQADDQPVSPEGFDINGIDGRELADRKPAEILHGSVGCTPKR